MNKNKDLKRIDGISVCIDFSSGLPSRDEYRDPSNRLIYSNELPLAREYLKNVSTDSRAISEEKILYISSLIKSCARDMKYPGFELLAEETSRIADDLIEIHAATEAAENVSA
jgi:hypothetical protein